MITRFQQSEYADPHRVGLTVHSRGRHIQLYRPCTYACAGVKYSVLKYNCTTVADVSTVDTDGAAACGNDARQVFLLESLPSGLNQRRQHVSPNGHGVRLGWHPSVYRAIEP